MYNYIMLIMGAIDEDRQKEAQNRIGNLSREQIKKEQNRSALSRIIGDDIYTSLELSKPKMVTIEITPEDMKRAKEEREERQKAIKERRLGVPKKKSNSTPSRTKPPSSSRK